MRLWLKNTGAAQDGSPRIFAFQAACVCGQVVRGVRKGVHQLVPCPACGAGVFILPSSPWLERAQPASAGRESEAATRRLRPRDWLLPLAACALSVCGLVLVYHWFLAPLLTPVKNKDLSRQVVDEKDALLERLAEARKLFHEGSFRLAVAALNPHDRKLDLARLSPEDRLAWRQVERQAALLADLLAESLEEVLHHAAGVREPEWQLDFRHRYQGKAVVLDAEFRKTQRGWQVNYPLMLGADRARMVVEDLRILERVPPHEPQRLVVGARLASLKLEPPGPIWVLRFQPDSGVFLTDPEAAARLGPFLADVESRGLLERQARWAE